MNHQIKKGAFLISLLFLSGFIIAQDTLSFGFRSSISAGKSILSGTTTTNNATNIGYSFGVLAELSIQKFVSLRVETAFVKKGFSDHINFTDAKGSLRAEKKQNTNLYYIDVPVMLKFSVGTVVKPYFLCGGWGGIYLGGKTKALDVKIPNSTQVPQDYKYPRDRIEYGIIAGPGLDIGIGSKTLFVELRPCFGQTRDWQMRKLVTLELGAGLRL